MSIVCEKARFEDAVLDTLLNPSVVIEVLSPSTEAHDRGPKGEAYRRIPSLQHHLLVAQDRAYMECLTRQGDGDWLLHEIHGLDAAAALGAIGVRLWLREVYLEVDFPAGARAAG